MGKGYPIQILSEEQLAKLTTSRLLGIHRRLTARTGFLGAHAHGYENGYGGKPEDDSWAKNELARLAPFEQALHRELAKREHVKREEDRLWRTLIRVERIAGREVHVVVPAWDSQQVVKVRLAHIPASIKSRLAEGKRLHARVNIGAEKATDLKFSDWERV